MERLWSGDDHRLIHATYHEAARLLLITGNGVPLRVKVPTRHHLGDTLKCYGLRKPGGRWKKIGNVLMADLEKR